MENTILEEVDDNASDKDEGSSRAPRVRSVAKAVSILFAVARSTKGVRANELAAMCGLTKQATYHLLHTLVTLGTLTKGADNRYLLGLKIGVLVEAFPRQLAPPERLLPMVRQIANETGETSFASGWREGEVAGLAVVRGTDKWRVAEITQGHYEDAHARAAGKLLLALADEVTRQRYFASHALNQRTSKTITSMSRLKTALEKILQDGYVVEREELIEDVSCLAVAVAEGEVPYAIGLAAPSERFEENFERYLLIVRRIAATQGQAG